MVSVAQWIARRTSNPKVVGSNPTRDKNFLYAMRCKYSILYACVLGWDRNIEI